MPVDFEYSPLTVQDVRAAIEGLPDNTPCTVFFDSGCGTGDLLEVVVSDKGVAFGTM